MIIGSQAGKSRICLCQRPEVCAGLIWILLSIQLFAGGLQTSGTGASAAGGFAPTDMDVGATATRSPAASTLPDVTNAPVPVPVAPVSEAVKLVTNAPPANLVDLFAATNGLPRNGMSREELMVHLTKRLELARYLRTTRQPHEAEPLLIELLSDTSPELVQQSALLELAALAQDENALARAQQIYAQFLDKWPNELRIPEILLRQGLLFRQMGLYNLAFTKFYGVMTSALVLKNDQLDYYVHLVFQAQTEIAETQYELGKYADAAEFFTRLLKQNNPSINKSQVIYKLARCHAALGQYADAASDAQDFLARYPDAPEQPELRFHLAVALKQLGRNNESLQQVLLLLQEQRAHTKDRPELWAYWQQRTGNLIANQLYREGDYTKALEIYLNLAQLDPSPQWQLPVSYQIGMTYERLWQPQKAAETYSGILVQETELGTNTPPSLKTVFDMARWRINFIKWQDKAESANRLLHTADPTNGSVTASLSGVPVSIP
jgi:tetratricopeptide (TPR) repeat protein